MEKKAYLYVNYKNIVVLKDYMDVIKAALEDNGYVTQYVESLKGVDKRSIIVFPMGTDAFKFYLKGYKRIILWQQGVTAEESFLRNHSKLRLKILNAIDCFVMKRALLVLYVSEALRKYYEEKAGCSFAEKSYLMPCFNEQFDASVFEKKDYSKKSFTYVGSLDLWQCFDKTVSIYAEIEKHFPDAQIKVLTFQTEEAEKILINAGVKNYIVKCVPKEQVRKELEESVYGFVIRDDIVVNRVATPTKLSSYLSSGVIPIITECLVDFSTVTRDLHCSCILKNAHDISKLISFIDQERNNDMIIEEIKALFDTYYNRNMHTKQLIDILKRCLN